MNDANSLHVKNNNRPVMDYELALDVVTVLRPSSFEMGWIPVAHRMTLFVLVRRRRYSVFSLATMSSLESQSEQV